MRIIWNYYIGPEMDRKVMHTSADTITGYNYQNKGKQDSPQDLKATHMIFY